MDKETKERIERAAPFAEFPKMKHHPDGRTATVNTSQEESALGSDWCNTPQQALDERTKRDEAAAKRVAAQIAKAKTGKDADDKEPAGGI